MTISPQLLQERLHAWPARIAWKERHFARTFAELAADISAQRRLWRKAGLGAGDRIALYSQDMYASWVASLAALGEGASLGLIPPRLQGEQILPYLEQLPFTFWSGGQPSPRPDLKVLPLLHLRLDQPGAKTEVLEEWRLDPTQPCLLIFSSGSSGQPKAIEHSFESLASSALQTLQFYEATLQGAENWLLSLDLSHIGGWQIALRCLLGGLTCIGSYAPHEVGLALAEQRLDFLSLVPTQLLRCLAGQRAALRETRTILLGGAACPPELLAAAEAARLPLSITYGSSETASQLAAFPPGEWPARPGEVGFLLPGWEARLIEGRLALRGPALCRGFWQAGVFYPALQDLDPHDTNPWFLSADRAAFVGPRLSILGRADHIFQVGGENLAPEEITGILFSLGAPGDWIVVPRGDAQYGEVPVLIYRSAEPPPPRDRILSLLQTRLPGIKLPRALYWHQSPELTKPSRQLYRALLSSPRAMELMWTL